MSASVVFQLDTETRIAVRPSHIVPPIHASPPVELVEDVGRDLCGSEEELPVVAHEES
jgi:hypothetical protein